MDNLGVCDRQYTIRHKNTNNFLYGEKVFLRSNPEIEMKVRSVGTNTIHTKWQIRSGKVTTNNFPPECILQYRYAELICHIKEN